MLQYSRPRFTTDIHKEDGRDRYARRSLSCQRELDDEEWPRVSKCTAGYHYRFGSRGRVQHLKASETRAAGHRHRSVSRGKVQQQHKAVMSAADLPHRSVSRARRQKTHNNVTQQQQNIPGTTSSIVSFYFTNVLEDISYNCLRQGFEVCGIMEDIYLARKRNVNGGVFGFVRYCKVRDVDKLLRALNNVWFGDCKVVAKVASFDRYGNKKGASRAGGEGGKVFEGEKIKEGEKRKDVGESSLEGEKRKDERFGGGVELDVKKGGEIVYGVNKGLEVATTGEGKVVVAVPNHVGGKASGGEVHGKQVFVPKYTSNVKDVASATKGLVVSVLNGDAISVLQRRIFDAGFEKLAIIPMGADKVFLSSLDDEEVSVILSEAAAFFNYFFSQPIRWNKETLIRERGAWVRIYGVPLHAWNIIFLKLCVIDCGRLLRVDDVTMDRDRFDYVRILRSTTSLEIINSAAQIMVDGLLFDFQII